MFDGTIGDWEKDPINPELKTYYKPFNFKYYPVPRINKENFLKELKHLLEIGVSTTVQKSQYGTTVFIIPKKEGTVRFITDYCRVKHQLIINLYPLPKIGETMQQLEGFQYATELDLNMGYFTIRLSPASQDMTMIVNEYGKFKYNHLPIGMCSLGYIFQSKVDKLLGDIKGAKTYIDDILLPRKYCFIKHIAQLRIIFFRLRA